MKKLIFLLAFIGGIIGGYLFQYAKLEYHSKGYLGADLWIIHGYSQEEYYAIMCDGELQSFCDGDIKLRPMYQKKSNEPYFKTIK